MQIILEGIRKIVVLVLLMELVLQLQSGKQYEPYIKILVGIMIVYTVIRGVCSIWGNVEEGLLGPMQEFGWNEDWYFELEDTAEGIVEENNSENTAVSDIMTEEIKIEEIIIDGIEVKELGGKP